MIIPIGVAYYNSRFLKDKNFEKIKADLEAEFKTDFNNIFYGYIIVPEDFIEVYDLLLKGFDVMNSDGAVDCYTDAITHILQTKFEIIRF